MFPPKLTVQSIDPDRDRRGIREAGDEEDVDRRTSLRDYYVFNPLYRPGHPRDGEETRGLSRPRRSDQATSRTRPGLAGLEKTGPCRHTDEATMPAAIDPRVSETLARSARYASAANRGASTRSRNCLRQASFRVLLGEGFPVALSVYDNTAVIIYFDEKHQTKQFLNGLDRAIGRKLRCSRKESRSLIQRARSRVSVSTSSSFLNGFFRTGRSR
jgi:hypothetical protein